MGNEGSKGQKGGQKGGQRPQANAGRKPASASPAQKKGDGGKQAARKQTGQKKATKGPAIGAVVWGEGADHQLGLGEGKVKAATPTAIPLFVKLDLRVHQVSVGPQHAAFVTDAGAVYTVGSGDSFRLGLGDREARAQPEVVAFTVKSPCVQVACGSTFTLFLTQRGNLLSCGTSKDGALGLGYSISAKMPMKTGLTEIRAVAAGLHHAAALSHLGKVYTWGSIKEGRLGHNSGGTAALQGREGEPKLLDNAYTRGKRFVDVACGSAHTVFVTEYGEVTVCGRGAEGQLGYGGKQEHQVPRLVQLVDDEEEDEEAKAEEESDLYGDGREKKAKGPVSAQAVRCFASGNASGAVTNKGEVWLWGEGEVMPTRVILPAGESALFVAPHVRESLILTQSRRVFSADLSESAIAETLEAGPVAHLSSIEASWIASHGNHFVVATGGSPPSLDETRSRVVANVLDRDAAKEASDNRKELFGLAKKPKKPGRRAIDAVEVEEQDTSLSKLKNDLFAMPAKKKVEAPPKEASPAPRRKQEPEEEKEEDIEDFKAKLFGDAAAVISSPSSPTSPQPAPVAKPAKTTSPKRQVEEEEGFVEAPPEMRNALFAQPAKKKQPAEKVAAAASPAPLASEPVAAVEDEPEFELDDTEEEEDAAPAPPAALPQFEAPAPVVKTGETHVVEELFEGDLLSDEESDDDLC